jgi:TatD DNase family protein
VALRHVFAPLVRSIKVAAMLVDSHCHLNYPGLVEELPAVLSRARAAGVGTMVCICSRLGEFEAIRAIAEANADVYCSVGVHPHDCGETEPVAPAALVEAARHPKVIGIGETGLDFYYDNSPRDAQEASFRSHIAAARDTGLPLIVHSRDADARTAEILTEEYARGPFPGLIHCFTAGPQLAEAALKIGFYISLSGIITFKNAEGLRQTIAAVPLERILVETDAPFLAPIPMRGKRNEPAFVVHTAARAAELFGLSAEALARATTANFFRLFTRAVAPAGTA